MNSYASRKFLLVLLTQITVTALVWFSKISDGVYSAVIISTVAAYITGNVLQKATIKDDT